MGAISPQGVAEIVWGVYNNVDNPKRPYIIDRKKMPFWSWINSLATESGTNGGVVTIKLKKKDHDDIQHHSGADLLKFKEQRIDFDLVFPYAYSHKGLAILHEELENQGMVVIPNGPRGKAFATSNSKDEALKLVHTLKEKVEEFMDAWDRGMDRVFHLDGTQDPLAPMGLDGILPLAINPGDLYGGKDRDTDMMRHHIALGLTSVAGGDLVEQFENLDREAELRGRDYQGSNGIDVRFCGATALQSYKNYCRANGLEYSASVEGVKSIDFAINDRAVQMNMVRMIHDPTFEDLDRLNPGLVTPWARRIYSLNSGTFKLHHPPRKLKLFSAPLDRYDQLVTRMSIFGRHCFACHKTNANHVASVV